MSTEVKKAVLWVDDDGPKRYSSVCKQLNQGGWDVAWATDFVGAASCLSTTIYHALILDQVIVGPGVEKQQLIWVGCRLLYWLRGKTLDTWPATTPGEASLAGLKPLPENIRIPAVVLSSYHNQAVEAATRNASDIDATIRFLSKPTRRGELMDLLTERVG